MPQTMEEDLGLSQLASKNDQRTFASFCHLELIRFELGFLGKLDGDFLVPHPGIPARCFLFVSKIISGRFGEAPSRSAVLVRLVVFGIE